MLEYLDLIVSGSGRCDVTPLFANGPAFQALVDDMVRLVSEVDYELVAGIDALGFVLGAALATRRGQGFIAIRKGGKLPAPVERVAFVDYTGQQKELEIQRQVTWSGAKVLLVDEWIETGAQVRAAASLLARQDAVVAGVAAIHCDENSATAQLASEYRLVAIEFGN